jgi:hypothetical protein
LPRVLAARRDFDVFAGMSERELKDIGLTRADVGDVTALPSDASPTEFLAARVEERRLARAPTSPSLAHSLKREFEDIALSSVGVEGAMRTPSGD